MEDTRNWITRTMENMDALIKAVNNKKEENEFTGSLQKQENYVNSSLERCPRCGDHVYGLMADPSGVLSKLCDSCTTELRDIEEEHYRRHFAAQRPPRWFVDLVKIATTKRREPKRKGGGR